MKDAWPIILMMILALFLGMALATQAAELPFETYEWTDGHGRVCTATTYEHSSWNTRYQSRINEWGVEFLDLDCDWPQYPFSPTEISGADITDDVIGIGYITDDEIAAEVLPIVTEELGCGLWSEEFQVCIGVDVDTIDGTQ